MYTEHVKAFIPRIPPPALFVQNLKYEFILTLKKKKKPNTSIFPILLSSERLTDRHDNCCDL